MMLNLLNLFLKIALTDTQCANPEGLLEHLHGAMQTLERLFLT